MDASKETASLKSPPYNSCVPERLSVSLANQRVFPPTPVIIYYLYNHRERPCGSCKFQELSEPCTFHLVLESSKPPFYLGEKGFNSKRNSYTTTLVSQKISQDSTPNFLRAFADKFNHHLCTTWSITSTVQGSGQLFSRSLEFREETPLQVHKVQLYDVFCVILKCIINIVSKEPLCWW